MPGEKATYAHMDFDIFELPQSMDIIYMNCGALPTQNVIRRRRHALGTLPCRAENARRAADTTYGFIPRHYADAYLYSDGVAVPTSSIARVIPFRARGFLLIRTQNTIALLLIWHAEAQHAALNAPMPADHHARYRKSRATLRPARSSYEKTRLTPAADNAHQKQKARDWRHALHDKCADDANSALRAGHAPGLNAAAALWRGDILYGRCARRQKKRCASAGERIMRMSRTADAELPQMSVFANLFSLPRQWGQFL